MSSQTPIKKIVEQLQRDHDWRRAIRPDGTIDPDYIAEAPAPAEPVTVDISAALAERRDRDVKAVRQWNLDWYANALNGDKAVAQARAKCDELRGRSNTYAECKQAKEKFIANARYGETRPFDLATAHAEVELLDKGITVLEIEFAEAQHIAHYAAEAADRLWDQNCPMCGRVSKAKKMSGQRLAENYCTNCGLEFWVGHDGSLYQWRDEIRR